MTFQATTNLAAAREIPHRGLLDSDDFRIRYDMLRVIHGVMDHTNKKAPFYKKIIPEIIRCKANEPIGFLREMMAAVVEIALVSAYVDSEVRHIHHYRAVEPFIRHQIAEGVNVDWNRMRLVEALWVAIRKPRPNMLPCCAIAPVTGPHRRAIQRAYFDATINSNYCMGESLRFGPNLETTEAVQANMRQ